MGLPKNRVHTTKKDDVFSSSIQKTHMLLGLKSLVFAPAMSHQLPRFASSVSFGLGDDLLGFVRGERHGNLRRWLLYSYEYLVPPKIHKGHKGNFSL